MAKQKALLAWSSGKDSAWALHVLRQAGEVEVVGLLTTVTEAYDRVSMHGVRTGLLRAQAASLGLPLHKIMIPSPCSNEQYERAMGVTLSRLKVEGVRAVVHGDIFLESVRKYREEKLSGIGIEALFPLWSADTAQLAKEMVKGGLKAYVTCLDPRHLPREFAGRLFDGEFLSDLPERVDPLGERGEFHTFCFDAPVFSSPIPVTPGETVEREGFVFTDLQFARIPK
jgi:uncharacterized protein (TIGR00290 family)